MVVVAAAAAAAVVSHHSGGQGIILATGAFSTLIYHDKISCLLILYLLIPVFV